MATLKVGEQARLVQPVIQGEVADIRYNKDSGCLEMLVQYIDAEGNDQSRWFLETELEAA